MTARAPRVIRRILAWFCLAIALPSGAIGLGEMSVHSHIGESFNATVRLTGLPAETPRPDCFSQGGARAEGVPTLPKAKFSVEPEGAGWRVRIQTSAAVNEPALHFVLNAACDGRDSFTRGYHVLLDPLPVVVLAVPSTVATPLAAAPAPVQAATTQPAGPRTKAGDTLASLARAIYPKSARVRAAFVQALRTANPALAGLAADQPIPPDTAYVLPDLKRFAMSLSMSSRATRVAAPTTTPRRRAYGATEDEPPPQPMLRREVREAGGPAAAPAPAPRRGASATSGAERFVLRLSTPNIDLSPSRNVDDRVREQLRRRLAVLDVDDQTAAMLGMRERVKELEERVTQLQLRLSGLPDAAPGRPGSAQAPVAALPPKAAPAASPAAPAASPAAPSAKAPEPAPRPVDKSPSRWGGLPAWLWGALALLLAVIGVIVWGVFARSRRPTYTRIEPEDSSDLDEAEAMMRAGEYAGTAKSPAASDARDYRVVAEPEKGAPAEESEAEAIAAPGADPATLRRRYIEERFPEIASGTIAPDSPDSIVKAARLFYEDGALARAVELLQFAVEENPAAIKPWLALFEIYRLQNLSREFTELAGRFRAHHGTSESWPKVQLIGRGFNAQDPLFAVSPSKGASGQAETQDAAPAAFDPVAENWLNLPLDSANEELATSLRAGLLADAGLKDADLVADPMPALKNAEKFNAA